MGDRVGTCVSIDVPIRTVDFQHDHCNHTIMIFNYITIMTKLLLEIHSYTLFEVTKLLLQTWNMHTKAMACSAHCSDCVFIVLLVCINLDEPLYW